MRLPKKELKPWQHKMWCIPKVDAEYVARMEDVLDLCEPDPSTQRGVPTEPVVCFDESPVQIIAETRTPLPAEPLRTAGLASPSAKTPSTSATAPRTCLSSWTRTGRGGTMKHTHACPKLRQRAEAAVRP